MVAAHHVIHINLFKRAESMVEIERFKDYFLDELKVTVA